LFKEREGIYLDGLVPGDQKTYLKPVLKIIQMMRQHDAHPADKILEGMRSSPTITTWDDSVVCLLKECQLPKNDCDTVTLNV
jgi:hypothetical protein